MKSKWLLVSIVCLAVVLGLTMAMAGCKPAAEVVEEEAVVEEAVVEEEVEEEAVVEEATEEARLYIAVISKGFQHQFWQTVNLGATDAAAEYDVDMTFEGPPSESDIAIQVDMINAALAKNPAALCLAALDTESVTTQLSECKEKGIPVVGFDSGVPNAPEGIIVATASTNNENAGKLAADSMFADPIFLAALQTATVDNPVVIGVLSQEASSASIVGRTIGFTDQMFENCETLFSGQVEVAGHVTFEKAATSGEVAVSIYVQVPPSTGATDLQAGAQALFAMDSIIAIYASNEGSVNGILAATTDGTDLDRENGKYKDIAVIGFDAGKAQKAAVRNGYFVGSITQDPYMIGYLAVELAVKAINGETIAEMIDTGAKFYNAANMDEPDIAVLTYD
ncbi:MAG TPA: LacI family transcriptional regulator [Actinobacteria bacterium]|nr:LacI family transcriptional regulator [Actinomycetota bacterium]